jgi:hypothetical protein
MAYLSESDVGLFLSEHLTALIRTLEEFKKTKKDVSFLLDIVQNISDPTEGNAAEAWRKMIEHPYAGYASHLLVGDGVADSPEEKCLSYILQWETLKHLWQFKKESNKEKLEQFRRQVETLYDSLDPQIKRQVYGQKMLIKSATRDADPIIKKLYVWLAGVALFWIALGPALHGKNPLTQSQSPKENANMGIVELVNSNPVFFLHVLPGLLIILISATVFSYSYWQNTYDQYVEGKFLIPAPITADGSNAKQETIWEFAVSDKITVNQLLKDLNMPAQPNELNPKPKLD